MHDNRRTRVVLGVLLAVALALITIDFRGGASSPLRGLRSAGGAVFGSAESAVSVVTRPVAAVADGLAGNPGAQSRIAALQRQVIRLRAQLDQQQLSQRDERQLTRLLQLAGRGGYRIVAANVVAAGPAYQDSVTIDVGRDDGVKPEETVLNSAGLVGTVSAVFAMTSTVLLSTDASVTVGVRLAGSGEIGVVTGTGKTLSGGSLLRLQVFDVNAVLHPGQELVTFGSANGIPYVAGVPVGVIVKVQNSVGSLTKLALVRPFANDGQLSVVGVVIAPPRTNPRFSVLPPSPAAAPAGKPRPAASAAAPSPGSTGLASTGPGG